MNRAAENALASGEADLGDLRSAGLDEVALTPFRTAQPAVDRRFEGASRRSTAASSPGAETGPGADRVESVAAGIGLVGCSRAHRELLGRLDRAAQVDAEVLIQGPSGVGKELYARFVHGCSNRRAGPFVAVNCGALPDALFENEMFGHAVGAFTGATNAGEGLVAAARGGTLLLDEVDTLNPAAQVKLLRLLQGREYRRLGDTRLRQADVRILAATNASLEDRVARGQLREDLFFRLRVVPVQVPPLRDRPEDVSLLLLQFVERFALKYDLQPMELSDASRERLATYHWPGNVRELENLVRSLTCLQLSRPAEPEDLPLLQRPFAGATAGQIDVDQPLRDAKRELVERFERGYLRAALHRAGGNVARAARASGKHRRAFFELLRKHGIAADDYRDDGD